MRKDTIKNWLLAPIQLIQLILLLVWILFYWIIIPIAKTLFKRQDTKDSKKGGNFLKRLLHGIKMEIIRKSRSVRLIDPYDD